MRNFALAYAPLFNFGADEYASLAQLARARDL